METVQNAYSVLCEEALRQQIERFFQPDSMVSRAAEYSLMNGGKRVRGVFVLAVCDMLEGDMQTAAPFAAAMEMVHAFSLIHDDLPCMDDDDTRRGKPACHVAYGEANALLAGDLLALEAFEVLAGSMAAAETRAKAVTVLAGAAGARGMIYGQELDLYFEQRPASNADLLNIHLRKTGALFTASVKLGILAAGQDPADHPSILAYAENVGYAFQIVDDILDITSTNEVLGKPVGSDCARGKNTYVSINGLDEARRHATTLTSEAMRTLWDAYGARAEFLCNLAKELENRLN